MNRFLILLIALVFMVTFSSASVFSAGKYQEDEYLKEANRMFEKTKSDDDFTLKSFLQSGSVLKNRCFFFNKGNPKLHLPHRLNTNKIITASMRRNHVRARKH